MEKKGFLDHITSIPVLMVILFVGMVVIFFIYIKPSYSYIMNSGVLIKNSYLEPAGQNNVKFLLVANLFPEIKKSSHYQKDITPLELQKAALRMELRVLKDVEENPEDKQAIFDLSMWYIISAGIRNNLNQLKDNRIQRLLAAYYYLMIFNEMVPDYKATKVLAKKINQLLMKKINNDRELYDQVSLKLSRNLEKPPTEEEIKRQELFKATKDKECEAENLKKLCEHYNGNIEKSNKVTKLAFILSARACYDELSVLSHDDKNARKTVKKLSKQIDKLKFLP